MDPISFRCSTCDHTLKVSADRAGRKVKCPRCNGVNTVPARETEEQVTAAAPAPAKKKTEEEEDDKKGYGLFIDPREEEEKKRREEEEKKKKKEKKAKDDEPAAAIERRVKVIYDTKDWQKVRIGFAIILYALAAWGLWFVLHELVVLIGVFRGPEYGVLADKFLLLPVEDNGEWPKVGSIMPIDRMGFAMSIISGSGFRMGGKIFFILAEVCLLVMSGMFLAAYGFFRYVPERFGSRQLVRAMTILCCVNLVFGAVARLIPLATDFGPKLFPAVLPEVAMSALNIERMMPLDIMWMHSPFWETVLSLIVQLSFYTEPLLIAVFLWNCGKILQEDYIEESAQTLTQLGGGVYFIAFAYVMLSLAGTSDVLVILLRVIYMVWIGFFVGYLIYFAVVLYNTGQLIDKLVADTVAEERATGKKKRSGGLSQDEDEEEDGEDEDEEYDDEDDE
jgi:phage FluMu protein Com